MNNTSLENAYSLIICERQLLSELKTIDEGTLPDEGILQNISDKVYNLGTGVGTEISNRATGISKWATGISKWATEDLPSYIQNLTKNYCK